MQFEQNLRGRSLNLSPFASRLLLQLGITRKSVQMVTFQYLLIVLNVLESLKFARVHSDADNDSTAFLATSFPQRVDQCPKGPI